MTDQMLSRPMGVAIPTKGSNIRVVATGLLTLVQGEWLFALTSLVIVLLFRRIGILAKRLRDAGVES